MATTAPDQPLDIREQIIRIDKMQAELAKSQVEVSKIQAEIVKVGLDTRLAPYTVALTGAGAAAALIAATITLTKLYLG